MADEHINYIVDAVDNASKIFDGIGSAIGNVAGVVAGVFTAGIAAATAAIGASVVATMQWGDQLDSIGDVLGTTAAESATLAVAIETVGGNANDFVGSLAFMQKGLLTVEGKIGSTGEVLATMGINAKKFSLMGATEQAQLLGNAFSAMPDGLQKSELMMGVFGKSGKALSDVMSGLANGGMMKAQESAKLYGLAMSDSGVNATVEVTKAIKQLELMGRGLAVSIGAEIVPILLPLAQNFIAFAREHLPNVRAGIMRVVDAFRQDFVPTLRFFQDMFLDVTRFILSAWPIVRDAIVGGLRSLGFNLGLNDLSWSTWKISIQHAYLNVMGTVLWFEWEFYRTMQKVERFIKDTDAWKFLERQWRVLTEWFGENWPLIEKTFVKVWEAIKPILGFAFIVMIDNLAKTWMAFKFLFEEALHSILGAVRIGMQLFTGDFSGAFDTVYRNAENFIDRVKRLFGIRSPSSVFADIGKNLMLGLERGIVDFSNGPGIAMKASVNNIMGQARSTSSNNYNLTVNSNASVENVLQSYQMMKALA